MTTVMVNADEVVTKIAQTTPHFSGNSHTILGPVREFPTKTGTGRGKLEDEEVNTVHD